MKKTINYIKKNYNFYILIGLTLAFHFVSSEAFLIGILILSVFYMFFDMIINKHFPINKKYIIIIPLLLYLTLGFLVGITHNDYILHNIIRDIFYHINSLVVVILALTMFSDKITKDQVFWCILIIGTFMGIHTLLKVKELKSQGVEVSYVDLRNLSNAGYIINFIAVISFLFIKKVKYITIPLSLFNLYVSIIAFSRAGIILLVCLFVFIIVYYILFSNHKFYFAIGMFVLCAVLIAMYINTPYIKYTIERFMNTFDELNFNKDFTDPLNANYSWRGYEVHMILEQFKVDNVMTRIFGHGFGSYIYSEIPITVINKVNGEVLYEKINEIPLFHNGYFGALFKCGIVGVLVYIAFLIMLYIFSFKYIKNKKDLFLNLALITYIVLATYVVMGLFHSEVWFPLVFLLIYLIKYHMDGRDKEVLE